MKYLSLILCLFLPMVCQVRAEDDAGKASARVREFYHWYVHTLNTHSDANLLGAGHRAEMKRYVAADFLRRIDKMRKGPDGLDGDIFLDAQDWDRDWETNIEVKDIESSKDGHATTRVTLHGKQMKRHLQVRLVREDGMFKISDVKGLDN